MTSPPDHKKNCPLVQFMFRDGGKMWVSCLNPINLFERKVKHLAETSEKALSKKDYCSRFSISKKVFFPTSYIDKDTRRGEFLSQDNNLSREKSLSARRLTLNFWLKKGYWIEISDSSFPISLMMENLVEKKTLFFGWSNYV